MIIAAGWTGLGDRILNIISCYRLSKLYSKQFSIYWPKSWIVGCEFEDIFSINNLKILNINNFEKIIIKNGNNNKVLILNGKSKIENEEELLKYNTIVFATWNIKYFFNNNIQNLIKEFNSYSNILKPNKFIQKKIDRFKYFNNIENCIGVHVRRGDIEKLEKDNRRLIPINSYFNIIDKIDDLIFLCTNSLDVEKEFIQRYGEQRVIIYKCENFDPTTITGMQDALIQICLMSTCKYIIGGHSAFSTSSAIFGNKKINKLVNI